MPSQRAKFTVGLFVASGMTIAVLAVISLGMSRFLAKGYYYVTYFNESVQGLDKDSPVKYRGVSIGRVESISVAPDGKLIQVVLKIESRQRLGSQIVAQLKSVGITGSMFVELDRRKEDEPDRSPPISFPTKYPIVASKPSEMKELLRGVDDVLSQIRSLDVKEISGKIKFALDSISQKVSDANVKAISQNIETSLEHIDQILKDSRWNTIMASAAETSQSLKTVMRNADKGLNRAQNTLGHVEKIVAENEKGVKSAIEDFREAVEKAHIFLEKGSTLATGADDSLYQLKQHLLVTAQNMEKASENLDRLLEILVDQPSQLIFGQPPIPRPIEEDGP